MAGLRTASADLPGAAKAHVMLRVTRASVIESYDFEGMEEYVIRLDPAVLPYADFSTRILYVDPPPGVLEQGRKSLLLQLLRRELQPFWGLSPQDEAQAPAAAAATSTSTAGAAAVAATAAAAATGGRTRGRGALGEGDEDGGGGGCSLLPRSASAVSGGGAGAASSNPAAAPQAAGGGLAPPAVPPGAVMPGRQRLIDAGRRDLVALVLRAGGFSEVAMQLGLQSSRRPRGYWSGPGSWERLDEEVAAFVAAAWVELPHPDHPARSYYYNQVSGRTTWRRPPPLQRLPAADARAGGDAGRRWVVAEAAVDRVMPSRSVVLQARRHDLHNAITYHGGYLAVAERLGRRVTWALSTHLYDSPSVLRRKLRAVARELELPPGVMPTQTELQQAGQGGLVAAIRRAGGFQVVAGSMRLTSRGRRRPRGHWDDERALAAELAAFATGHGAESSDVEGVSLKTAAVAPQTKTSPSSATPSARTPAPAPTASAAPAAAAATGGTALPGAAAPAEVTDSPAKPPVGLPSPLLPGGPLLGLQPEGAHARTPPVAISSTPTAPAPSPPSPGSSLPSSRGAQDPSSNDSSGNIPTAFTESAAAGESAPSPGPGSAPVNGSAPSTAGVAPGPRHLPSRRQLQAAGRHDLLYGLRRHARSRTKVAELGGLRPSSRRGTNRNALSLEVVQSAIQASCHTPKAIREHLQRHHGVTISRQHLTTYLGQRVAEGRLVKMSHGRYGMPAAAG